jgi:integrase
MCFSINGESRDSAFRHARGKAGIVGLTFHDSRALALTRLSKKLDVLQLARVVGHRDPRSLMIYYRESAADMAKLLG